MHFLCFSTFTVRKKKNTSSLNFIFKVFLIQVTADGQAMITRMDDDGTTTTILVLHV